MPSDSCLHLVYSFECNLRCGHCIYRCGPDRGPAMGLPRAREAIAQAARAGVGHVVLNGGEPFLHLDALHDLARSAREHRIRSTVVTSGYWAASLERAVELLRGLRDAGVEALTLSTDRYHLRFVPQQAVLHALAAARRTGMRAGVKISRLPWDPVADGLLRSVLRLADKVHVQEVSPLGRADCLREALLLRPVFHLQRPACNTPPVLLPDGRLLCCCNLPARDLPPASSPFVLGSLEREPLHTLLERRRDDPLLRFLRVEGPLALYVPVLSSAPAGAPLPPSLYHDGCDLCFHLFRHPWARRAARRCAETAPGLIRRGDRGAGARQTRNVHALFPEAGPRNPATGAPELRSLP